MNFVPVDLAPWNAAWLTIPLMFIVVVIIVAIILFNTSKPGSDAGFAVLFPGLMVGIMGFVFTLAGASSAWDDDQQKQALAEHGFTDLTYDHSNMWIGSDDGAFVRLQFLTVDGQSGYAVIK